MADTVRESDMVHIPVADFVREAMEKHPLESSQSPAPVGLIAGPAADIIGALRERVAQLEARDQVYQSITTGFASMLGSGQYALPFAVFERMAGASVLINPVEEADVMVFSVRWPEPVEAAGE